MRSAVIAAAFAAGVLAVPYQKRDVVTETDMNVVYVTDVVTITQGYEAPASTVEAQTAAEQKPNHHWGHKPHHWTWTSQWTSEATEAPAPSTTEAPPPPSSTYEAPPPPSSTEEATTEAPAPTTWAQPTHTKTKPASTPTGSVSGYQDVATYHHNIHRANHSAPAIQWDSDLEASAAQIAASCVYAHNVDVMGGGYGQNIAAGVEPSNISAVITDLFYNGEEPYYSGLYGQDNPDMTNFEKWGHFSQIVWKDTTHFACATQDCSAGGLGNVADNVAPYFTVCNYKGPGNYAGEYGANVLAPIGDATAQWNAGM